MLRLLAGAAIAVLVPTALVAGDRPDGRELFERVWLPDDERSHGGDGLGPVFNANSCVACHNQGGAGGAGSRDHNVKLLSADIAAPGLLVEGEVLSFENQLPAANSSPQPVTPEQRRALEVAAKQAAKRQAAIRRKLVPLHADFAESNAVVIHRHGTDATAHATWRKAFDRFGAQVGQLVFSGNPVPTAIPQQALLNSVDSIVTTLHVTPSPNSFPEMNAMMARVNAQKAQAHPNLSPAVAFEGATMRVSQRNTTALWGAGRIDRISNETIEALAKAQREAKRGISGRPHRLPDGKLGRFGWKGQKASLLDFTLAACANELGLNVPGVQQARVSYDADYEARGLDLNQPEVDALVRYIAELPVPRRMETTEGNAARIAKGHGLFAGIGCADCHVENVGEVTGLFSDLLLHDMGADLGASGSYGSLPTPPPIPQDVPIASADGKPQPKPIVPPSASEWRTPPLWGVASSAPYLHDGRAKTIEQAIAFHGGEAAKTRLRYLLLEDDDRAALHAFLDSLVAPKMVAAATKPATSDSGTEE